MARDFTAWGGFCRDAHALRTQGRCCQVGLNTPEWVRWSESQGGNFHTLLSGMPAIRVKAPWSRNPETKTQPQNIFVAGASSVLVGCMPGPVLYKIFT